MVWVVKRTKDPRQLKKEYSNRLTIKKDNNLQNNKNTMDTKNKSKNPLLKSTKKDPLISHLKKHLLPRQKLLKITDLLKDNLLLSNLSIQHKKNPWTLIKILWHC